MPLDGETATKPPAKAHKPMITSCFTESRGRSSRLAEGRFLPLFCRCFAAVRARIDLLRQIALAAKKRKFRGVDDPRMVLKVRVEHTVAVQIFEGQATDPRSEERRVGKE